MYLSGCIHSSRPNWFIIHLKRSDTCSRFPTSSCRLLNIQDTVSKLSYLIDTGAEVCVLSPRPEDRFQPPNKDLQLQAANGITIRTLGRRSVSVELGLAKPFEWKLIIADVSKPILGADFLRHYDLLIDLKRKRLTDAETCLTVPTEYRRSAVSRLCLLEKTSCFSDILSEFQEITTPCIKKCRLQGMVKHYIDTRCSRPVFARARRLSPDKLAVAKEEFRKLLEMDIIQPSSSPWSLPLHMVAKPPGGWRACGDYRALNAVSEDGRYPMPHLQDYDSTRRKKHLLQSWLSTSVQPSAYEYSRRCKDSHRDAFWALRV